MSLVFAFAQNNIHQAQCVTEFGSKQSPVNIVTGQCELAEHLIDLHYEPSHEHLIHEEHCVKLDYDPGSYIVFDGDQFDFLQFHFHTPSEHHMDGDEYPLEMHMVHFRQDTMPRYLVIGLLFEEGKEDPFIKHFLNAVPETVSVADYPDLQIDISQELMPSDFGSYYHYDGSLTTPPYTETVEWVIVSKIHTASITQIKKLEELEGPNNRKIQELKDRVIQECHSRTITYKF